MVTAFLEGKMEASVREPLVKVLSGRSFQIKGLSLDWVMQLRGVNAGLVVLDVKTSGESAFTTLRRIRKEAPDLPVLVLTPRTPPETAGKALTLGAAEYLVKPFAEAEVVRVLDRLTYSAFRNEVRPSPRRLSVPLAELHQPTTGRLDAEKIADYLGVPLSKLSPALGANYTAIHKTPAAAALQEGLTPIKRSLEILSDLIGNPATVRAWLNREHPDLGMRTPISVILDGQAEALRTILENAIAGVPA